MLRHGRLNRVTIVEDHALFAEALELALSLQGLEVRRVDTEAEGLTQNRLLTEVLRSQPGVVLLDLQLGPGLSAVPLIRPLSQVGVAVVVVTGSVDRSGWGESLFNGARTVLPKSTPLSTILATIRLIGEGRRVLTREDRERLVDDFHRHRIEEEDRRARLATLTTREREILAELMDGRHVREIAQAYVVSEATVRTQVKSILSKLGVSSQLAAVGLALRGSRDTTPARREG
ncbi:response regulator transcription factor [Nocardioides sp. 503]|uniref:LuxR C-terminal-related transcriptional regulator n=1 Tax=Nocardioides sp. 503 TaxID=2508326 RepID=UPI00106F573C|nr:response regulator transcription factor [Nocardioides sp. 503]